MVHYTQRYRIKVPQKCINLKNTKEIQLNDNIEWSSSFMLRWGKKNIFPKGDKY